MAGNAVGKALGDTLGGTLLANAASGLAGAAAGGALGGSAGAMSGANGALSADLFNRQLHPQERTMISTVAKGIAAANGKTPADQAKLADYWTNMLTLAAGAKVDAQAQTQLTQYEIQLVQAAQASGNSQALDTFMQNLKIAQNAINQMSGYTISGTTGAIVADGSTVKTFQSTSAQFNDSTLFGTPGEQRMHSPRAKRLRRPGSDRSITLIRTARPTNRWRGLRKIRLQKRVRPGMQSHQNTLPKI